MTDSVFKKGNLVDGDYQVQFFLYEDELSETYRVKTNKDELKFLKLIKPEISSALKVEALNEKLRRITANSQQGILECSELETLLIEGDEQYYFVHDFVHGESLKQVLNRDITIQPYEACKIISSILSTVIKSDTYSSQVFLPDNVFISYLEDDIVAKVLPVDLSQYIKKEVTMARYSLAYESQKDENNCQYSLATLLYKCLFGYLPWHYDIEWIATHKAVKYQVLSYRGSNPLNQSTFHSQYVPHDLKNILFQSLTNIELGQFAEKLNSFIKQYYEFPYNEEVDISTSNFKEEVMPSQPTEPLTHSRFKQYKSPNVGLNKIAGMRELKSLLTTDIIEPLNNKDTYIKYGIKPLNGILFYGPPGCGKTFIGKQLAAELGYTFFEIKPSDLASIYVHGTQEKIGKLFTEASLKAPSVIFIDEVDAIMPSRDSANMGQHYSSEVNEFLAQLTECSEKGILTIMATNRPDAIDSAILRTGRVDKTVYIPLPDFETRREMLEMLLEGRPVDSAMDLKSIAMLLASYTSSDINYIVNEAAKLALKEGNEINSQHLKEVLGKTKSSVSNEQLRKYDSFANFQRF
jgi:transitional endoplasmic reticulum ATPase